MDKGYDSVRGREKVFPCLGGRGVVLLCPFGTGCGQRRLQAGEETEWCTVASPQPYDFRLPQNKAAVHDYAPFAYNQGPFVVCSALFW